MLQKVHFDVHLNKEILIEENYYKNSVYITPTVHFKKSIFQFESVHQNRWRTEGKGF